MRQVKFYRHAQLVILGRELTARIKCAGQGKERHSNGDNRLQTVNGRSRDLNPDQTERSRADYGYSAENQCSDLNSHVTEPPFLAFMISSSAGSS